MLSPGPSLISTRRGTFNQAFFNRILRSDLSPNFLTDGVYDRRVLKVISLKQRENSQIRGRALWKGRILGT